MALPSKAITSYLLEEPFKVDGSMFCGRLINDASLDVYEVKSILSFCSLSKEQFFKKFIIKKNENNFDIISRSSDLYQISSPDPEARKFIDEHCSDQLIVLPYEFKDYKEEDGISKADDLHSLILNCIDVNEHKEQLVDIIKYKAKYQFLNKLSEIAFVANSSYSTDCYEYKILELACSELKENDFSNFQSRVRIKTSDGIISLSDIPPITDKIIIENFELRLSEILPNSYQNSHVLSKLIDSLMELGLPKEKVHSLFGVKSSADYQVVYEMLSTDYSVLVNYQQLAFLILYNNERTIDFDSFKVETLDNKSWELKYSYYCQPFSFIGDDYLLKEQYSNIQKVLNLPINIGETENQVLTEPYFLNDKFICPCLKSDLSNKEKTELIDFIYSKWNDDDNLKQSIKNIAWSKINDTETKEILGFNPKYSVYPNDIALENEETPDFVQTWLSSGSDKTNFLSDFNIWTHDSTIADLRKYLKGDLNEFANKRLAQEKHFDNDEKMLFNSFEWLKANNIQLSTDKQFETFKKVVDIINENRDDNDLRLEIKCDFEILNDTPEEWDESFYLEWKEKTEHSFSIYLYNGELPKNVGLDEISDCVFYKYNEGDIVIGEKNDIHINKSCEIKKALQKLAADDENDFSYEHLWDLFGNTSDETDKLRQEVANLKNKLQHKSNAELGAGSDDSISRNDQIDANREAKEIVKERLENEGYDFTQGINGYSTIDGVYRDETEFPLVVKSYKWNNEPLKIGANEWLQLMKPNSMFWVHFGNRKLGCLKLYELLKKQDNLTLRFDTENLDHENRLHQFAELLHYFENVHFDFNNIKEDNYSTAESLEDYRFDERNKEDDLSSDNEDIL